MAAAPPKLSKSFLDKVSAVYRVDAAKLSRTWFVKLARALRWTVSPLLRVVKMAMSMTITMATIVVKPKDVKSCRRRLHVGRRQSLCSKSLLSWTLSMSSFFSLSDSVMMENKSVDRESEHYSADFRFMS